MISIVIPAFNEEPRLAALLTSLAHEPGDHEVILVDGGSTDKTLSVARHAGARVLKTEKNRGLQLARGAEIAKGESILFLHADSKFPFGGLGQMQRRLDENLELAGGNFRLLFDGESSFSRRLTKFYAWLRRHGIYYGDSAIFVRKSAYVAIGGIRPIALMEDYEFVRRLERHGPTIRIEDPPLITSSRKFEGRSSVSIVWGWLIIHVLFYLGVPPKRLAQIYYDG